MSARDYSSSDEDKPRKSTSERRHDTRHEASASLSPSKARGSQAENQRVKLTLRPSINHLMNDPSSGPSYSAPSEPRAASPRSSLSPPPPITLKLGLHNRTTMAERMAYSSDSDNGYPPSKKPKTSRSKSHSSPKRRRGSSSHLRPMDEPSLPAQHRKTYDWLQPSTAGASHRGPPERAQERYAMVKDEYGDNRTRRLSDAREEAALLMGWRNEEERRALQPSPERGQREPQPGEPIYVPPIRPKRSHKKKLVEGPGKAWRKGLKKGMAVPWIEGGTFMPNGSIQVAAGMYQPSQYPGDATPGSAGSPEPQPQPYIVHPPQHHINDMSPRGSPPPFVLADPEVLGFPVYSKPITAPKLVLSNFPKVTTFFMPNNGGDVGPFPRKEPVRSWTQGERTYVGVGGGQLKFKTWNKGPTSRLAQLIQADKEADKNAREIQRREAKAAAALNSIPASDLPPGVATWAESRQGTGTGAGSAESTPAPSVSAIESLLPGGEEEAGSEVGEGDAEPLVAVDKPVAVPKKRKPAPRASGGKAKLKKSKLGQEITVDSTSTSAIEELM